MRVARGDDHRQARPAARLADPDRRHRADRRPCRSRCGPAPNSSCRSPPRWWSRSRWCRCSNGSSGAACRRRLAAGLCVIIFLLIAVFAIGSIVIPAIDWVAQVPRADRQGPRRRSSRCSTSTRTSTASSTASSSQIAVAQERGADGADRDAQLDARAAHHLGAAPADPAVLRAAGDLLLPRRLDRDAQADDRQPRQLRRRADHRAGDPAGGRRDLDLSRHDHAHQRRPGRADRADPVAARHGFAGDVGRHRRGAQLHPLSRADRLGAAAVPRRADDLSRRLGRRCCRRRSSSASTWSRPISSRR